MLSQNTMRTGGDGDVAARNAVDTRVRAMSRDELAVSWQRRWRRPPPKGISRRLLECSAAWLIQAEAHGGLAAATRRRLDALAGARRSSRDCAEDDRQQPGKIDRTTPRRKLRPGSRLVRQWQGRSHVVEVIDGGFTYEGRSYTSLTAIAREITGARWSGPRFFGLNAPAPERKATRNRGAQRSDQKGGPSATMDEGDHDD
ncbi:DUF2924 domain-containing protein [Minwuia sp. IMCC3060]|uniref:DUF2924 domain-containing protein n=1 Tax=Minwuia sp. IMCC3060 TaxID=3040675 RepID=UPI00247A055C|nr:DUF2924 domain-containing protein [Minwuia sp. IMCC3060]